MLLPLRVTDVALRLWLAKAQVQAVGWPSGFQAMPVTSGVPFAARQSG
ncbi:hypothetical protein [Variovorax paradoxus]|nr:hypothetical protein [Variovorax paradoxus]